MANETNESLLTPCVIHAGIRGIGRLLTQIGDDNEVDTAALRDVGWLLEGLSDLADRTTVAAPIKAVN